MLAVQLTLSRVVAAGLVAGLSQGPTETFTLADVAVDGARRVSVAEVLKAGVLTVGQSITVAEVGDAANRLSTTGLFESVRYRYVTLGRTIKVTFEVEEIERRAPVVFDNFVWFSNDELSGAIRARLSSFDGTAPASDGVVDTIRQALGALLAARGVPGQVRYTPAVDLLKGSGLTHHVFAVTNPGPKLCALHFPGAGAVPARDLLEAVPDVVGQEYSRVRLDSLITGTLTDVYRQRGFWQAVFKAPIITPESSCGGVTAVLSVTEGPAFVFERAEWVGNAALPPERLDALLGMRSGERAGIHKLRDGLRDIARAYGRQGYVQMTSAYEVKSDETARRVTFAVNVNEGPQFQMGSIAFAGFSDRDAQELTKKWRLKSGDVYDADYPIEFRRDHVLPLVSNGGGSTQPPSYQVRLDPAKRLVHVLFSAK